MEEWRTVETFPEYEVSDQGRVRRVGSSRCLSPSTTKGYQHVMFTAGKRRAQPRVHVLVCAAFHGPKPTPRHQAAHRDGVRSNNVKTNLRWATPAQNAYDKRSHGSHLQGSAVSGSVLVERDIRPIRSLIQAYVPLEVIAEAYGVTPENVAHIRDGKRGST